MLHVVHLVYQVVVLAIAMAIVQYIDTFVSRDAAILWSYLIGPATLAVMMAGYAVYDQKLSLRRLDRMIRGME